MDEPLTMERGGNTYYYHRDGLGSITEITDESGVIVERYEYDVYGAVTIFDGSGITLTTSARCVSQRFGLLREQTRSVPHRLGSNRSSRIS
jgi:hypothetical protein